MRKLFYSLGALLMAGTLSLSAQSYELRVLTFEDGSEKSGFESLVEDISTWSNLIDDPQQYGQLLYGDNNQGAEVPYSWTDGGNTELHHEFIEGWSPGYYAFYSGGEAISHYWSSDLTTYGDYMSQLTLYRPDLGSDDMNTSGGGHNGSDNFCVHFGYIDNTGWGLSYVPGMTFADDVARVIDHVYVCMTTYSYFCITNGNDLSDALGEDGKVWLQARGFAEVDDEDPTSTLEFLFADGTGFAVLDWTKWDLYELGAIKKLEFNIYGEGLGSDNGYGFSQPAYFAWDDMAVRFPKATPEPEPEPTSYERTGLTAGNYGTICLPYAVNSYEGAEFYKVVERNSEYVTLEEVTSLTAGEAYIFRATATTLTANYTGEAVGSPKTASAANVLQGSFENNKTIPAGAWFLYHNTLYQSTGVQKVDANRAYLTDITPAAAPAPGRKRVTMPIQRVATDINATGVQNTNARKVMINSHIYIRKDGHMYDMQGQIVK